MKLYKNTIYRTSSMLKTLSRGQLLGRYPTVIGALVTAFAIRSIMDLASSILTDRRTLLGTLIYYIILFIITMISGIFNFGEAYLYLKLICSQQVRISDIFHGFRNDTDRILSLQLYLSGISFVCMIPGFIGNEIYSLVGGREWFYLSYFLLLTSQLIYYVISLMLSQAYYLMLDFPDYRPKELLLMSIRIMKGHKGRLFYIHLSFFPLLLLGMISMLVPYLWILPYMNATMANFYIDLMQKRKHDKSAE